MLKGIPGDRPKLGQIIKASDRIRRGYVHTRQPQSWRNEWEPFRAKLKAKPVFGIYIGWRTYSNGKVEIYDGSEYTADWWFEAWLIVADERQKPVPVLPADVVWEREKMRYSR